MTSQPPTPQAMPKLRLSLHRARPRPAVDVDLLVGGRAVAAVGCEALATSAASMHMSICAGELAAADGVEGQRRAGGGQGRDQILDEGGRARIAHVRGADGAQEMRLARRCARCSPARLASLMQIRLSI